MGKLNNDESTSEKHEHLFSPERPIKTLAEDELGRKGFATAIAKVVHQWTGRDSLVIAIYGPWGSGKSSIKNMVLDALHRLDAKAAPLEFNPWEWASQQKIFEGFFGELAAKLGPSDSSSGNTRTAAKLRMYGAMLSAAASITRDFRWLIVGLLIIVGFFGLAPLFGDPILRNTLAVFGGFALLVALVLAAAGETADKIATYLTAKVEANRKNVAELKKELQRLLRASPTNVLVVVDDVDRLTPDGIRMVFQLVGANADFPNLVYLLLFQRDTIEKALTGMGGAGEVDGAHFLEKIVQVGFDIPKLSPRKIEESIESVVSRIVERAMARQKFDSQRWGKLFVSAIRPYFQTLRDVKRFCNTLSFHFELYRNGEAFDANPIDLVALEVLRQFEAPLYNKLFAAKPLLTGAPRAAFGPNFSLEGPNAAEALIEKATRPEAKDILINVFPPFAWMLAKVRRADPGATPHTSAYRAQWLNELRPCHPELFERYFKFSLSAEELSESEISSLLAVLENRDGLVEKLRQLSERGLLGAAVLRLGAQNPVISPEGAARFVTGIFDMEKELFLEGRDVGVATVPTNIQAVLIIGSVLRQIPANLRRGILSDAIDRTTALYLPMIAFESSDEERKQAIDPLVSDMEAKSLQELCVNKIRAAKTSSELLTHPRLRYIVRLWSQWAHAEEVSSWLHTTSVSDSTLPGLLNAFVERMDVMEGARSVRTQYRFALEDFSRYIEPDVVADRVRSLASSDTNNRWILRLFLDAFDRWKASGQMPYPQMLGNWTTIEQP
jgi:predicted KAP-like P-loop ATPase